MELGLRRVDAVAKLLILLRTTFYPKWSGQNARSGTENFDFAFALPKEMPPPPVGAKRTVAATGKENKHIAAGLENTCARGL